MRAVDDKKTTRILRYQMRGYLVPVISIAMIVSSPSARSDEIPTLDVRPVCRGIASQAAEPLATGLPSSFEQCVKSEEQVREQLRWPTFSAADKQHCVTLAKTGGELSNTELLTCLEMARDVQALRSAAAAPSGTERAKQPAPSPSMPTVQPEPAAKSFATASRQGVPGSRRGSNDEGSRTSEGGGSSRKRLGSVDPT